MEFEIICTFSDRPQVMLRASFRPQESTHLVEEDFLCAVFDCLGRDELTALEKLSCAQLAECEEDVLPFIMACRGKFFFNTDVNPDDDTRYLSDFRDMYVNQNYILHPFPHCDTKNMFRFRYQFAGGFIEQQDCVIPKDANLETFIQLGLKANEFHNLEHLQQLQCEQLHVPAGTCQIPFINSRGGIFHFDGSDPECGAILDACIREIGS